MKIRTLGLMSYPIVYNINITYTLLLLVLWVIEICYLDYFIVISENIQIDYELLSEKGKKDYDKMKDIQRLKVSAVNNQEFERAADLRDVERSLDSKIRTEFSMNTDNPHFILAGKMSDIVICNNPGNLLITLIK